MLQPFELTLSTGRALPMNGRAKASFAPQNVSRIDGFATRGAADIHEVRIRRHSGSKERSGRIDHALLPWPTLAVGDVLEVTLQNHKHVPAPVSILLRGVVVS